MMIMPSYSSPSSENISQTSSNSLQLLSSSSSSSESSSPVEMNSSQKLQEKQSFSKINGQENIFETIAKLAGINNNNNNNEEKEIKENLKINDIINNVKLKEEEEEIEENKNINKLIKQKDNQHSSNNNYYFTSSSRRKNGNPIRMINENIIKNLKRKRDKEEEKEEEDNKNKLENEFKLTKNSNKIEIDELLENNKNEEYKSTISLQFDGFSSSSHSYTATDTILGKTEEEIMNFREDEGVEQQQRKQQFYAQFIKKYIQQGGNNQNNNIIDIYKNFGKNLKPLKEELNGICSGDINKVFGDDFSSQELYGRLLAVLQQNVRQHQWTNEQFGGFFLNNNLRNNSSSSSFPILYSSSLPSSTASHIFSSNNNMPSLSSIINSNISSSSTNLNIFNNFLAITQNPLIATAMATAAANSFAQQQNSVNNNGIFPSKIITETNKFIQPPLSHPTINLQKLKYLAKQENDGSPRKKRQKVTDSVRGPRSNLHCRETLNNYSTTKTTSDRSTSGGSSSGYNNNNNIKQQQPLPTMVFPSNNQIFRLPDKDGGSSSDDDELERDNNNYFINESLRSQLTHVHLRKAKLMFFYQRYPSSSVLKSYFPDVQFNKHNTAQLVKWFSNFREFFYMQMEKFAKQALAEGVKHQEEIIVTSESEIFKQINQHYNKNNVFQPPERLQFVVQDTLREFFTALKEQKDLEPSWKKSIYKIIQQLDEPIPDYFRDYQFVEMLENAP